MSDNEKKKIQWADLDSYKKRYIESMEDGLGRTWLWMYFSGFSVEDIAAEYVLRISGRTHGSGFT